MKYLTAIRNACRALRGKAYIPRIYLKRYPILKIKQLTIERVGYQSFS